MPGCPTSATTSVPYGDVLNAVAVPERHITDVVTAVNFDYRGFDTLGEEFILFAAVVGVAIILRAQRDEEEREPHEFAFGRSAPRTSDAVRGLAIGLIGPTVVTGLYIVAHGHLTPGGGFQGGVVLATALLLVYLAAEYSFLRRAAPLSLIEVSRSGRRRGLRADRARRCHRRRGLLGERPPARRDRCAQLGRHGAADQPRRSASRSPPASC